MCWIAKNRNGFLYLFMKEPMRSIVSFESNHWKVRLDDESFPEVTWENSPKKVELKIID